MSDGPPCKKAFPAEGLTQFRSYGVSQTHIYDLGDCLHEVAKHVPLNSCLRNRLVSKRFAQAFGWAIRALVHVVGKESESVIGDLRRVQHVYPAAATLHLVLESFEDLPRLQAVVDQLRLEGPPRLRCFAHGPNAAAAANLPAAGVSVPSRSAGAHSGNARPPSNGAPAASGSSPVHHQRSSYRVVVAAVDDSGSSSGAAAGAQSKEHGKEGAGGTDSAACGGGGCGGLDASLSRVSYLTLRCNLSCTDLHKERQRYRERISRRRDIPLLQWLGLPPALLDVLQEGREGGLLGNRDGYAVQGPADGEHLLDLDFLQRMPALVNLRLEVPLDLRPARPAGGLAALTALRQLRRLELLPVNGLTSGDIAPLGELGSCLERLELFLDDSPTLHWHRRAEGYAPPDPSNPLPQQGHIIFLSQRMVRDGEYANRVYPAWAHLNAVLVRLTRLTHLSITGAAPFWLPMGQHLLSEYPQLANLELHCTGAPGYFKASPLDPDPQQQRTGAGMGGDDRTSELLGVSPGPYGEGPRRGTGGRPGRHLSVTVRHGEGNTLLEDAIQLLPVQPVHPQDEISLEIGCMGTVRADLGVLIQELLAALPVQSLVLQHATWTEPRVATEILRALAAAQASSGEEGSSACGCGSGSAARPSRITLRKLQVWSPDQEAYEVSKRVLIPQHSDSSEGNTNVGGERMSFGSVSSGPQELVIHGPLPDTLGPLLPPTLKRLSLANRPVDDSDADACLQPKQAIVQVECVPEGLGALDMQHMKLQGTVPDPGLSKLSHLSLRSCALSSLDQLGLGPSLRQLALFRNSIDSSSMEQLADSCPGIVELSLQETFSPDAVDRRLHMTLACADLLTDLHHIARLSRLESLSLPIPHSCDGMTAMVPHLAALPSLNHLTVHGLWDLCVPSLTCLKALKRLEWLKLHMVVDTRCYSLQDPATVPQTSSPPELRSSPPSSPPPEQSRTAAGPRIRRRGAARPEPAAGRTPPSSATALVEAAAAEPSTSAGETETKTEGRSACKRTSTAIPSQRPTKRSWRSLPSGSREGESMTEGSDDENGELPPGPSGSSGTAAAANSSAAAALNGDGANPSLPTPPGPLVTTLQYKGAQQIAPAAAPSPLVPVPRRHDAHTVSRELYSSLSRDLPHTRVTMKLISITFRSDDEMGEGVRVGGAGGGPDDVGVQNGPNGGGAGGGGGGGAGGPAAAAALVAAAALADIFDGGGDAGEGIPGAAGADGPAAGGGANPGGGDADADADGGANGGAEPADQMMAVLNEMGMQLALGMAIAVLGMPAVPVHVGFGGLLGLLQAGPGGGPPDGGVAGAGDDDGGAQPGGVAAADDAAMQIGGGGADGDHASDHDEDDEDGRDEDGDNDGGDGNDDGDDDRRDNGQQALGGGGGGGGAHPEPGGGGAGAADGGAGACSVM
ncbi:hypothetical protein Vafri_5838 [Volvox africanus]|nr:hypothetical protein Vafri_5838 [Volvox africanus]